MLVCSCFRNRALQKKTQLGNTWAKSWLSSAPSPRISPEPQPQSASGASSGPCRAHLVCAQISMLGLSQTRGSWVADIGFRVCIPGIMSVENETVCYIGTYNNLCPHVFLTFFTNTLQQPSVLNGIIWNLSLSRLVKEGLQSIVIHLHIDAPTLRLHSLNQIKGDVVGGGGEVYIHKTLNPKRRNPIYIQTLHTYTYIYTA